MQRLLLPLFLLCTVSCTHQAQQTPQAVCDTSRSTTRAIVDARLCSLLERLDREGITERNALGRDLSTYSTPFIQIDRRGYLHVVVQVTPLDEETLQALRAAGIEIEVVSRPLGQVQGWMPFYRTDRIASLPFVERIAPPRYGRPK